MSDAHAKTSSRRRRHRKKKPVDKFKLVIRLISPSMREDDFQEQVNSIIDIDSNSSITKLYYVQGSPTKGTYNDPKYSRAYYLFDNIDALNSFRQTIEGKSFFDPISKENFKPVIERCIYNNYKLFNNKKSAKGENVDKDPLFSLFSDFLEKGEEEKFSLMEILKKNKKSNKRAKNRKKKSKSEKGKHKKIAEDVISNSLEEAVDVQTSEDPKNADNTKLVSEKKRKRRKPKKTTQEDTAEPKESPTSASGTVELSNQQKKNKRRNRRMNGKKKEAQVEEKNQVKQDDTTDQNVPHISNSEATIAVVTPNKTGKTSKHHKRKDVPRRKLKSQMKNLEDSIEENDIF